MVALSDGEQHDAFIRCFRSGRCNALQSGLCRGVEPAGRRVRLLSVLTHHGIRPVWLRSPDKGFTQYGGGVSTGGTAAFHGAYSTYLERYAGVAFGFKGSFPQNATDKLVALSGDCRFATVSRDFGRRCSESMEGRISGGDLFRWRRVRLSGFAPDIVQTVVVALSG